MKTENKKKSQKKIQIKGKMPLSVHFFRDAEADALNKERCQLDKATLIACAVKRLREDLGNVPDSGKKPSACLRRFTGNFWPGCSVPFWR